MQLLIITHRHVTLKIYSRIQFVLAFLSMLINCLTRYNITSCHMFSYNKFVKFSIGLKLKCMVKKIIN